MSPRFPYATALAAALALAVVVTPAGAQETSPDEMAAWMAAISPGEHHAVLEPLAGEWDHALRFWMAPGVEPAEMTATSRSEWVLGGRFLSAVYAGDFMGMPFEGRELLGYDNVRGEYVSVWFDNMSTGPMIGRGAWDATTRTLEMKATASDPMSGRADIPVRSVIRFQEDGTTVFESYTTGADGEEYLSMEIVSRKRG